MCITTNYINYNHSEVHFTNGINPLKGSCTPKLFFICLRTSVWDSRKVLFRVISQAQVIYKMCKMNTKGAALFAPTI